MLDRLPSSKWTFQTAAHLLARAGFSGPPAQVEQLFRLGLDGAVDQLLEFDQIPDETPSPTWATSNEPRMAMMMDMMRGATEQERREAFLREQRRQRQQVVDLQHWWLERMVQGPRPLQEKLTLFWHGHFATSAQKVRESTLMLRQNELFRKHAHGNWLKLLIGVSQDPAMLIWLDQAQSNRMQPNENYARELMELFTLGEGNYTEQDVREAARALTGFTLDRSRQDFMYRPELHDDGEKTLLGQTGPWDGWSVLRMISERPRTEQFITAKLWQYFAEEPASGDLTAALVKEFRAAKQEFKPVLRKIFRSEEFYSEKIRGRQVKSPVHWLVSTVRLLERPLPSQMICTTILRQLGQELFLPPNVKGWEGGLSWITTNSLLDRYNYTELLVLGRNPLPNGPMGTPPGMERMIRMQMNMATRGGTPVNAQQLVSARARTDKQTLLRELQQRFLLAPLTAKQTQVLHEYLDKKGELENEEILQAVRLMMCTPEYQLT